MRTAARFEGVGIDAGHYESFYIKATEPGGGRSVWLRYTVHKRPSEAPTASLWLTLFDTKASGPRATKATFGAAELGAPEGTYIKIDGAELVPGSASGSISGDGPEASWDLRFTDGRETLYHLPYERLYTSALPRTKLLSPYPASHFDGELVIGGERVLLAGWPGMVGHNWGSEHAERWIWLQASDLGGRTGDYIDAAIGRVKIGRWTTPWVANGQIVLDGEPLRLGGLTSAYGTEVDEGPAACELLLPGRNVRVKASVKADPKDVVAWVYADPKGPEHNTLNCSISDLRLDVERPGHKTATVEVSKAAAYELGSRDTDHGIALQPFADG
ncbi:MAG: hypothetical protein QOH04_1713 [Sphingomonadales bacterium]|nr:hypothetical protein [Sphingomonadales bacterium]